MTFTQPCCIHKNNELIRYKLQFIGYTMSSHVSNKYTNSIYCFDEYAFGHTPGDIKDPENDIIDCGENVELFLAIAAITNNNDRYQWFVNERTGDFIYCDNFSLGDFLIQSINKDRYLYIKEIYDSILKYYHKATPEELIKYFNNGK